MSSESRLPETSADTGVRGPSRSSDSPVGLVQTARGLCTDEAPHVEIDELLGQAVEAIKDDAQESERRRRALEQLDGDVGPRQQAIITQTLRPPGPADQQGAG